MPVSGPRPGRPEIIGHGGAGAYAPPNSEASIHAALAIGVDRIELDVLATGDGHLVLLHDDEIVSAVGTRRPVTSHSLPELRGHVAGLLTLDEAAEVIGRRAPLLLDLKAPGYEPAVADAIRRHGWTGTGAVSSTHALTLRRLRRRLPGFRLGLSVGHWAVGAPTAALRTGATLALRATLPFPLIGALTAAGGTEVMLRHEVATGPLVALLQQRGWRVNVWTVDQAAAIERALRFGVDGIISNRPDLARRIADAE